jgi:protein TonB
MNNHLIAVKGRFWAGVVIVALGLSSCDAFSSKSDQPSPKKREESPFRVSIKLSDIDVKEGPAGNERVGLPPPPSPPPPPPRVAPSQQNQTNAESTTADNRVFDKVEIEASFPGGDSKWRQYLERNANGQVATENGAPAGTYTTVIQFVVDKDGSITNVKALTNHGYGMENESIRIIKAGPKWNPAVQDGRLVKAYRNQPITFRVEDE